MIGVSKREHIFKNNFNKFDKIIFRNSWHHTMMPGSHRRWGRSIILEEIGLQYFSHTQRVLDKNLCLKKLCLIEV